MRALTCVYVAVHMCECICGVRVCVEGNRSLHCSILFSETGSLLNLELLFGYT